MNDPRRRSGTRRGDHRVPSQVQAVWPRASRLLGGGSGGGSPPPELIYVDPAEAAAIEALADQCELSLSELVTIAIEHWYGEDRPFP
jgi:hypothetical protein